MPRAIRTTSGMVTLSQTVTERARSRALTEYRRRNHIGGSDPAQVEENWVVLETVLREMRAFSTQLAGGDPLWVTNREYSQENFNTIRNLVRSFSRVPTNRSARYESAAFTMPPPVTDVDLGTMFSSEQVLEDLRYLKNFANDRGDLRGYKATTEHLTFPVGEAVVEYEGDQIPFGPLRMSLSWSRGRTYPIVKIKSCNSNPYRIEILHGYRDNTWMSVRYPHPHVLTTGSPCWGNARQAVESMIKNCQFRELFDFMRDEYLQSYNEDSPYLNVSNCRITDTRTDQVVYRGPSIPVEPQERSPDPTPRHPRPTTTPEPRTGPTPSVTGPTATPPVGATTPPIPTDVEDPRHHTCMACGTQAIHRNVHGGTYSCERHTFAFEGMNYLSTAGFVELDGLRYPRHHPDLSFDNNTGQWTLANRGTVSMDGATVSIAEATELINAAGISSELTDILDDRLQDPEGLDEPTPLGEVHGVLVNDRLEQYQTRVLEWLHGLHAEAVPGEAQDPTPAPPGETLTTIASNPNTGPPRRRAWMQQADSVTDPVTDPVDEPAPETDIPF